MFDEEQLAVRLEDSSHLA